MDFLESLGLVELSLVSPDESSTGKGSYRTKITDAGKILIKKLSK